MATSPGSAPRVLVGTSGWRYRSWRGTFYPLGLRQRDELAFASRRFGSIEINGTFYSLQRPSSFAAWRDETPDDFVLAVKGSRFVTHMKKLRDVDAALANFFAQGLLALGGRLGPVLWQFPASMPFDLERFAAFFARLPRSTAAAARLARRHDARVRGRCVLTPRVDAPIRHAVEVRHEAFFAPRFLALLERHDIAFVVSDGAGRWPTAAHVTASFAYVRLHGSEELYVSGYRPAELDRWAATCRGFVERGLDVFVYFDNDAKVHAPADAEGLMRRLGIALPERAMPALRGRRAAGPAGPDAIGASRNDPRWRLGPRRRGR
jgi:uncharacterized protein YecE (DUF72 family)